MEQIRQLRQQEDVGTALIRLPFGHGLIADAQPIGQRLLGQSPFFAGICDLLSKGRGFHVTFLSFADCLQFTRFFTNTQ